MQFLCILEHINLKTCHNFDSIYGHKIDVINYLQYDVIIYITRHNFDSIYGHKIDVNIYIHYDVNSYITCHNFDSIYGHKLRYKL